MARRNPKERAAQAAELSARQIRRYYEKGGKEIDSTLLPVIYKLAPSLDFLSENEQDHPKSWEKKGDKFKDAIKNFRIQAEKAGHTVPAASDDWVSFDPSRAIPLTNESSDKSPETASRQPTVPSTSSNTTHTKAEDEPMEGVTPVPPTSRDPSSAPTGVPGTGDSSAPRQATPIYISSASSSPTPFASTTGTPATDTRGSTASAQPSVETPPREQPDALGEKIWPRFKALVPRPNESPGWRVLQQECLLYGCDFADVMFRCEFRLKHQVNDDADGLRAFVADWIRICPEALDFLDGDCHGDSTMKGHISAWRSQHPRQVPQRRERDSGSRSRLFSEDPELDRQQRGFVNHLKEPYDGWDDIKFEEDPDDPENGEVMGKIKLAIAGWLDVALPSLNEEHPDKERHILVRESDYPEAARRFSGVTEGCNRTFKKSADKSLLRNKKRSDFKVLSYSTAKQERDDLWPRTYTTAYLDNGDNNSSLNVWARTSWHYFGKATIDKEINNSREEVGQQRVSIAK